MPADEDVVKSRRLLHSGWAVWVAMLIVGCVLMAHSGGKRTVTHNYAEAAKAWIDGRPLYSGIGHGFLYLPQAALLYVPFAAVPEPGGDILWRAISLGLFALGALRMARLADPDRTDILFLLLTLVAAPRVWSVVLNGQSTLLLAACIMHMAAELSEKRWWVAAFWIALGLAVKPLMLVPTLLAAAIYRPMSWRVALALVGVALLPFFAQSPSYVASQYHSYFETLRLAAEIGKGPDFAQLFTLLGVLGVALPDAAQTAVRLLAAVGTLALCLIAQRRQSPQATALCVWALAACYLMLFNPRTENNTYALVAPAMGLYFALEHLRGRHALAATLLVVALSTAASYELGRWLLPGVQPTWLAPTACLVFLAYVARQAVGHPRPAVCD